MGKEGRSVLAGTDERQDTVPQAIKLAEWRVVLEEELTKLRECGIYPTFPCKNIRMISFCCAVVSSCVFWMKAKERKVLFVAAVVFVPRI